MPWLYGPMAAGASGVFTVVRDVRVEEELDMEQRGSAPEN